MNRLEESLPGIVNQNCASSDLQAEAIELVPNHKSFLKNI